MIGRHWIVQVLIVAGIFFIDYNVGTPFIGFCLAILYFLGSLVSLIKGERYLAGKRFAYMILFIGEMIAASTITERPPDVDLQGFIDGILDELWWSDR